MMAARTGAAGRKGRGGEVSVVTETTGSSNNDSSTSTTSPQKGGGASRLPSIKERRPSVQKKARTSSVNDATNDTTTTTTLQRQDSTITTSTSTVERRASLPQGANPQSILVRRKPTFAGIGRRVSSMVRCRLAFQTRRKSAMTDSENEPNHMERIHEMPRSPRFSTFMSPEAQYAMMKGYEDRLYETIAETNPESRLVLKRNKTPHHKKISIVDNEAKKGEEVGRGENSTGSTSQGSRSPDDAFEPSSPTSSTLPSPFLKTARSHSTLSSDVSKSSSYRAGGSLGFALHRSSSLPTLDTGLSHEKRLVLTYRLESAMDILDTLRRRNKENALSPRMVRIPRQVDAVRDFNLWTKVWNKEFKEIHVK